MYINSTSQVSNLAIELLNIHQMYCLFFDLFIKIADWTLSTVLHLFCLVVHWMSSGSPVDVQWTEHLAKYELFLSLSIGCPLEVRWKSDGHRIPASPTISASKWLEQTFIGLCLDWQRNLVISNGFQRTPMDFQWTVRWVHWKWLGNGSDGQGSATGLAGFWRVLTW